MSIPKFNLSKLRESVMQQQSVTRKDIANLLLLDRLQSMVKRQYSQKKNMKSKDNFITIVIMFEITSLDGDFYVFDNDSLEYKAHTINETNIMRYLIFDQGRCFDDSSWEAPISSKNYDGISRLFLSIEDKKPDVNMYLVDKPPFQTMQHIQFIIEIPLDVAEYNLREYRASDAEDKEHIIIQYSEEMGKWENAIEAFDNKINGLYNKYLYNEETSEAKDILKSFNKNLKTIHEATQEYSSEEDIPYVDTNDLKVHEGLELLKVVGLRVLQINIV